MKNSLRGKRMHRVRKLEASVQGLLLAVLFLLGVLLGYTYVCCSADTVGSELTLYLKNYLQLGSYVSVDPSVFLQTLVCYFRTAVCILLLGFSFAGVLLIPCLCALQGFFFSFALFSFAFAFGRDDFLALFFLFSLRFLLLPCTFFIAVPALKKSLALAALSMGKGKRAQPIFYESAYWFRFCAAGAVLFAAASAETWLLPRILLLLLH